MTRAPEHPPVTDPEPAVSFEHADGETLDSATSQALNLAHRAVDKFPHLSERYRSFAGPAVIVSGALVALAGVAVARRLRRGQKPEEILEEITPEEIERAMKSSSRRNQLWRMVLRIGRRRMAEENGEAVDIADDVEDVVADATDAR
jgi:hypothetical protein